MKAAKDHLHEELQREFQLDRLIIFSDGVFAIAITLLVLDIRIPDFMENVTDQALVHALVNLLPKFAGFIISFMLIGLYWSVHHRIFGYVSHFSSRLLILNLIFLFFIALMPFSTGFYGNYMGPELISQQLKVPMTFYVANLCMVGICNFLLWSYISNPKNKLIDKPVDPYTLKMSKVRALVVPSMFLIMLIIAYVSNVSYAVWVPALIPVVMKLVHRLVTGKKQAISKR